MIRTSRYDIPRSAEGSPPDPEPKYLPAIIGAWLDAFEDEKDAERGEGSGSVLWASDAGSCARQINYKIRERRGEYAPSNPFTVADRWRFAVGNTVHSAIESAIEAAFPGSEAEVRGSFDHPAMTFRMDALIKTAEGKRVAGEWKTVGGWGYKSAATSGKSPAEGPRDSWFLQGAIAAYEKECDELVVGIIAMENLSPAEAKRQKMSEWGRFTSEWTFTPDQFIPAAKAELDRLASIMDAVDNDVSVPRVMLGIPLGAQVVDPATGRWELRNPEGTAILDSGSAWACAYCSHALRCTADKKAGL